MPGGIDILGSKTKKQISRLRGKECVPGEVEQFHGSKIQPQPAPFASPVNEENKPSLASSEDLSPPILSDLPLPPEAVLPAEVPPPGPAPVPVEDPSTNKLALSLVDLYDEINILHPAAGKIADLSLIQTRIKEMLDRIDLQIIHGDQWDAEQMRAVEVKQPANQEPDYTIVETVESGIRRNSKILRKQSVVITKLTVADPS